MPTAWLTWSNPSRLSAVRQGRVNTVICCGPRYISELMNMTNDEPERIFAYALLRSEHAADAGNRKNGRHTRSTPA